MTIFIELLLIITVSVVVGYPLFVKNQRNTTVRNINRNGIPHLLAQKEVAYSTLKDLDFDFKTGKLSEEDYQKLKYRYEKEALAILERIDTLSKKQLSPDGKKRTVKEKREKGRKREI